MNAEVVGIFRHDDCNCRLRGKFCDCVIIWDGSAFAILDFDQYKVRSKLAVTIPNETNFNINAVLASKLPEKIGIGYIAEEKVLALRKDDAGHVLPKSGTLKLLDLIQILTSHGMLFPARFTITYENGMWIGILDPQSKQPVNPKKPPLRKKKPDLVNLAKEAESL